MAQDYYRTLGVERTASAEDIKRAYRKLAHQYHPDKAGGDEERFKEVNEAYQVLGDEQKRAQYDQFGTNFDQAGGSGGFGGFGGFNAEDLSGFSDIFEQFFGGGGQTGRSSRTRRGNDVAIDTTISFVESAQGLRQSINTRLYQTCEYCHGNGAEPGTPIETCPTCHGQGSINTTRQTVLGVFTQRAVCPECHGEGKKAKTPCKECRGEGRQLKSRTLEVDIPAGIADGQTLRISGKGEVPLRGGTTGDLYVTVHVKPHKELVRDNNNVRSTVNISFVDAALGTTTSTTTLKGSEEIHIPAGTQPGTEIRLSGAGFPSLQGRSRGDQIVTIKVEIPKKLSKDQKKLLEQFKKTKPKKGLFG